MENNKYLLELLVGVREDIKEMRSVQNQISADATANRVSIENVQEKAQELKSKIEDVEEDTKRIWKYINIAEKKIEKSWLWIKIIGYCVLGLAIATGILSKLGIFIRIPLQ